MVVVKVREVYDLHTIRNKMSLIGIHTPHNSIIKANFPGLLMNCKYYRPISADVAIACASVQPADPLMVGTGADEIAPEDLMNPILYKACTNESFSLIESNLLRMATLEPTTDSANGATAVVDSSFDNGLTDDFNAYYGLLADAHAWRHAMPQAGLTMTGLTPLVYGTYQSFGGVPTSNAVPGSNVVPSESNKGTLAVTPYVMRGSARPMPRMPCTVFTNAGVNSPVAQGFSSDALGSSQPDASPIPRILVGAIIIPPSRLHELYFRMVVEWSVEFTEIRSAIELTNWNSLQNMGAIYHLKDYSFETLTKTASLADANIEINKVM